ncbi:hypothetical protein CGLO_05564 [Colletotrichum gloeosporioides Cg-14]|uniref:Uncharacterized protein n=1 Tax=Colletotrichum gloeosporioides (strain Cg-14) TaxID=1237896 RepID=T0LS99_COLGC|nr:hypothetical protein CGLO_05564 [Colletotrichum gloeosporioides Cg-14]
MAHKSSKDSKKKMSSSSSTYAEQGSAGPSVNPRRTAEQSQYQSNRAAYAQNYPQVQYKDDRHENRDKVIRNVNDLGDPRFKHTYDPNLDI